MSVGLLGRGRPGRQGSPARAGGSRRPSRPRRAAEGAGAAAAASRPAAPRCVTSPLLPLPASGRRGAFNPGGKPAAPHGQLLAGGGAGARHRLPRPSPALATFCGPRRDAPPSPSSPPASPAGRTDGLLAPAPPNPPPAADTRRRRPPGQPAGTPQPPGPGQGRRSGGGPAPRG